MAKAEKKLWHFGYPLNSTDTKSEVTNPQPPKNIYAETETEKLIKRVAVMVFHESHVAMRRRSPQGGP
jgi:hypothetical protein